MVEGHNQNISSNDSIATPDSKSGELITWVRSLQQALTVEVDHGFKNIQGRTNKFSSFHIIAFLYEYFYTILLHHDVEGLCAQCLIFQNKAYL